MRHFVRKFWRTIVSAYTRASDLDFGLLLYMTATDLQKVLISDW